MARERVERGADAASAGQEQPQPGLSIAEIRQLMTLMDSRDLEEIVIERASEGLKLVLRKPAVAATAATLAAVEPELDDHELAEPSAHSAEVEKPHGVEVTAPLVGVFRASMQPDGSPLVGLGDAVREGQVVGAIEALNVLNEVEANGAGRVREIRVADGQPVEYGQPLLVLE